MFITSHIELEMAIKMDELNTMISAPTLTKIFWSWILNAGKLRITLIMY
jgi:hypothetical protein